MVTCSRETTGRLCILAILLAAANTFGVVLVSPAHKYYPIVKEHYLDRMEEWAELEAVSQGDSREECIRKIMIALRRYKIAYLKMEAGSPKNDVNWELYDEYEGHYEEYCKVVHDSYLLHHDDPFLTVLADDVFYQRATRQKVEGFRPYGLTEWQSIKKTHPWQGNLNAYPAIIALLLPVLEENDTIPRVGFLLWLYFSHLEEERKRPKTIYRGNALLSEKEADTMVRNGELGWNYRVLDVDLERGYANITLLKDWWGSQVDPQYIDDEAMLKKLAVSRKEMEDGAKRQKAAQLWLRLAKAAQKEYQAQLALVKEIKKTDSDAEERKRALEERFKNAKAEFKAGLEECKKKNRKLDFDEIERLMVVVDKNRRAFRGHPDFPMLQTVRELYPDPSVAFVFNIYYKYRVFDNNGEIYGKIEEYPGWQDNESLVFIRLMCATELEKDKAELRSLAERLVKLNPGKQQYKYIRKSLEE